MEVVDKYFWLFFCDMDVLNVLCFSINLCVIGYIQEQIKLIEEFIEKGYVYELVGSVYFDVWSWFEYGKFLGCKFDDQEEGICEVVCDEKCDFCDFVLWKKVEFEYLMCWDLFWSVGFFGWYIECLVMSLKYFGEGFDIYGGGFDL